MLGKYFRVSAAQSSLYTNLTSYWSLEEASGTRVDAVTATGNDLTDNNTVTQNPGRVGNAAQFTFANTEWLSRVSNASLQTGSIDFAIAVWVYRDSTSGIGIVAKDDVGSNREYGIYLSGGTTPHFYLFDSGGAFKDLAWGSTITASAWHFFVAWHQNGVGLNLQVDDGTPVTLTATNGCQALAAPFSIGSFGGVTNYFDGRIDEAAFWKNFIPSSTQRTWMYNSGNGRAFSEFPGAP